MQELIITIRTMSCTNCDQYDSVMLSEREVAARVKLSPLDIGAYSIKHRGHTRIIYFDVFGEYLGDTLTQNEQEVKQILSQEELPPFVLERKRLNVFQRLQNMLTNVFSQKSLIMTITGPSRAGKTSLARYLKTLVPERETGILNSVPTMGKSTHHISIENSVLQVIDMGGQEDFWTLWEEPVTKSHCIIFVVDATSMALLETAEAFESLLLYRANETPVLVILNKKDLLFRGQTSKFSSSGEFLSLTNLSFPLDNVSVIEASIFEGIAYMGTEEINLAELLIEFIELC